MLGRLKAELLVPYKESWRGVSQLERSSGARAVDEGGPLGRWREHWHDLVDAEGRCSGLDHTEVGYGVSELGHNGAELERMWEGPELRDESAPPTPTTW